MGFDAGMKKFKEGDFVQAAHEFVSVTEADEHNHKGWNALGICLSKTGEYESAATCFENALAIEPDNATYKKNQERNDKKRAVQGDLLELDENPVPVKQDPFKKTPLKTPIPEYKRNWLQVPLFFVPIICMTINPFLGVLVLIGCAWYIKTDAENLNAGCNPNGSMLGKLKGWEWAVLLFLFWILLPLYSWKREQIYKDNLGYGDNHQYISESLSVVKIGVGILGFLLFCVFISAFVFGMGNGVSKTASAQNIQPVQSYQPITAVPTYVTATVQLTPIPTISDIAPISLSGTGQQAAGPTNLMKGLSIFSIKHSGNRHFSIWLKDDKGNNVNLLVNEVGSFDGSKAVEIPNDGDYYFDIDADGKWSLEIEQPRNPSTDPFSHFFGVGQSSSPLFTLDKGLVIIKMKHSGNRHFSIWLKDDKGNNVDLLVNEVGSFDGSKAVTVPKTGTYIFDIDADGEWDISK